jgi:hypothetical protein
MIQSSRGSQKIHNQFETLVGNTVQALQNNVVRAQLGKVSIELQQMFENSFCPDFRSGTFVLPADQRGTANPAIIPVTNRQAGKIYTLIEQLYDGYPLSWQAWKLGVHNTYGTYVTKSEIDQVAANGPTLVANAPDERGLIHSATARMSAKITASDDKETYFASRPIIIVRDKILKWNLWSQAATMFHEGIHAVDLLHDGPLYDTLRYGASSELRSYHASTICYAIDPSPPPESQSAFQVEAMRQHENRGAANPYRTTRRLLDFMQENNYV